MPFWLNAARFGQYGSPPFAPAIPLTQLYKSTACMPSILNSRTCLTWPEPIVLGSAATPDADDVTASAAITTALTTVSPFAFMGAPYQPARLLAISVADSRYLFVKSRLIQVR